MTDSHISHKIVYKLGTKYVSRLPMQSNKVFSDLCDGHGYAEQCTNSPLSPPIVQAMVSLIINAAAKVNDTIYTHFRTVISGKIMFM